MPKKTRKTRITKEQIELARKELKITSQQRKKTIKPGPWTDKETKLTIIPVLREHQSVVSKLGKYSGFYKEDSSWNEKGWYPLALNVTFDDIQGVVLKNGLEATLIAIERGFNATNKGEKKKYGDLILLGVTSDNSQHTDPARRFISVTAKTNKRNIIGFAAVRSGELIVLSENNQQNQESTSLDLPPLSAE